MIDKLNPLYARGVRPIPVIPTVYTDALSYGEQLGIVGHKADECVDKVNEIIEDNDTFKSDITEQQSEFEDTMQGQYNDFLEDYQRQFGVVQEKGVSITDVMSQKAVSDEFDKVVYKPDNSWGLEGQVLESTGNGIKWSDIGAPTQTQVNRAVTDWLDDHPEATTTVLDNSLDIQKLTHLARTLTRAFVVPTMFGAKSDDDTAIVHSALASGYNVLIDDNYKVKTGDRNLVPSDHTVILFIDGALTAINENNNIATALYLTGVEDVTIINGIFNGDALENTDDTEGANHGITCRASNDLNFINCTFNNWFTDGLYFIDCEDVYVANCVFNNCLRMGSTVTNGKNILYRNCSANGGATKSPARGFGLEPNYDTDTLFNIRYVDCKCEKDGDYLGAYININKLKSDNVVKVSYEGCTFTDGFFFGACAPTGNIKGQIIVKDCTFLRTKNNPFSIGNYGATNTPNIIIENCQIYNGNNAQASSIYASFFGRIYDDSSDAGNVALRHIRVYDSPYLSKRVSGSLKKVIVEDCDIDAILSVANIDYVGDFKLATHTVANAEVFSNIYREIIVPNNVSAVARTDIAKGTKTMIHFNITNSGSITFNGLTVFGIPKTGNNTVVTTTTPNACIELEWIDTNLAIISKVSDITHFVS